MEGYVYILKSTKSHTYYIGSTNNLSRRLVEHNTGKNKSTKHHAPWNLVFYKIYNTVAEARHIEYRIKKLKSKKIIEKIITDQTITLGR